MIHKLSELPYEMDALENFISKETLEYHYGKHHAAYVNNLNNLIPGTEYEYMAMEDIIKKASGGIFNNAAQIWNHTFYWSCLSPNGGGIPTGALAKAIDNTFGSFDEFKKVFSTSAATNFGSGWTWLVMNSDNKLEIVNTSNADTPIADDKKVLLTIDVWEHAYYIDYRNARPQYIEEFWNSVNWNFAANNL